MLFLDWRLGVCLSHQDFVPANRLQSIGKMYHSLRRRAEMLPSVRALRQATRRNAEERRMRKLLLICVAAALLCGMVRSQNAGKDSGALTVIRAGNLIDGASDVPRKNQLIFVHGKRIDADDSGTASGGTLKSSEHAGVIGAGILADDKNCVSQIEIGEFDGAFAGADGML